MSAQWPVMAARLVALLPTLPGWADVTVFDGAARDVHTNVFATIGHVTDGTNTQSGNYTKQQSDDGYRYAESGSVACQVAYAKPGDLAKIRATLFDLFDSIEDAIRADRRLGVLSPEGTCSLTVDLSSAQATGSASYASIAFSIDYYTVT